MKLGKFVCRVPSSCIQFYEVTTVVGINFFQIWVLVLSIPLPIGSMYAIYGNIYHKYTPVMLAYIAAPWIRHGL